VSANNLSRRSFLVLASFIVALTVLSTLGLAIGILQLTSSTNTGWSLGPLSCGCSVMAATGTTMRIVPWGVIALSSVFFVWMMVNVVRVSLPVRREWQRRRAGKVPAQGRLREAATRLHLPRVFLSHSESDASTLGWWRPEILVSDRLVRGLPTGELLAVLAHEAAHQTHHDPARLFWIAVFEKSFGALPAVQRLAAQFRQGIEQAADQASVARLGGAFPLSRALTRLVGWRLNQSSFTVASFAPTPDRLQALLQPTRNYRGQYFIPQLLAVVIVPLLAMALLMRPAGATQDAAVPGTMCHAPAICRFINASPAAHQSQEPLNCAAEPSSVCLNQ
jgi:Zn-dependent protease with chaperone function